MREPKGVVMEKVRCPECGAKVSRPRRSTSLKPMLLPGAADPPLLDQRVVVHIGWDFTARGATLHQLVDAFAVHDCLAQQKAAEPPAPPFHSKKGARAHARAADETQVDAS